MRELTETKKTSKDETVYAPEGSHKPAVKGTALTSSTLKADAKVGIVSENLKVLQKKFQK